MNDLPFLERRTIHDLHAYREIAHEELRAGRSIRFWNGLARSAVKDLRILRAAL